MDNNNSRVGVTNNSGGLPTKFPFRIGLLLIDDFGLLSYSSIVEPLRAANLLTSPPAYEVSYIVVEGQEAVSSSGAFVRGTEHVGGREDFDLLLVVAGGDPTSFKNPHVFQWLRRLDRKGVTLGGVSGGPLILAAAGVMEGRRMTVHWEHAPALMEISPSLLVERNLYVIDRNRVTCAGGVAPLDLMHALFTEHHGEAFARKVSDWFLHTEIRPAGGPQRAGLVERYGTHSPALIAAIEAMENHIGDPLELGHLASLCDLSPRQLNRLFREKMGQSTMVFYRGLRLQIARNLLTQSTLSITEIALATGFANSAHF
ncbi:MAG: GlxA family transcriptional regulator, partial [Alphaproteobacteria bacterium]